MRDQILGAYRALPVKWTQASGILAAARFPNRVRAREVRARNLSPQASDAIRGSEVAHTRSRSRRRFGSTLSIFRHLSNRIDNRSCLSAAGKTARFSRVLS